MRTTGAFTPQTAPVPPAPPLAPAPPSGPAQELVASMYQGVAEAGEPGGEVLVGVQGIRNHSHASPGEFDQMLRRFADALSRAGSDQHLPIRFVAERAGPGGFDLAGTAYLVTASGFDLWEMYLDLRPAGETWTVWRAQGALRMLRQPRGGELELRLIPD